MMMPEEGPARHDDGARDGPEVKYAVDQVGTKNRVLRSPALEALSQPTPQKKSQMAPSALSPIKFPENKWDRFFEEGGERGQSSVVAPQPWQTSRGPNVQAPLGRTPL